MSPYETLGVARDATPESIRQAFRREASKAHPDRHGGDNARMAAVNDAYALLNDPERRKLYDETGATSAAPTLRDEAIQALAGALVAVIEAGSTEPLLDVGKGIRANREDVQKKLLNLAALRGRLNGLSGRVKTKSAINIVQGVIDQQLAMIPETEKKMRHALKVMREAEIVLSEYEQERDGPTFEDSLAYMLRATGRQL